MPWVPVASGASSSSTGSGAGRGLPTEPRGFRNRRTRRTGNSRQPDRNSGAFAAYIGTPSPDAGRKDGTTSDSEAYVAASDSLMASTSKLSGGRGLKSRRAAWADIDSDDSDSGQPDPNDMRFTEEAPCQSAASSNHEQLRPVEHAGSNCPPSAAPSVGNAPNPGCMAIVYPTASGANQYVTIDSWAAQVQTMANHLQSIAAMAPSSASSKKEVMVQTDTNCYNVYQLEAVPFYLERAQLECQSLSVEADARDIEVQKLEESCVDIEGRMQVMLEEFHSRESLQRTKEQQLENDVAASVASSSQALSSAREKAQNVAQKAKQGQQERRERLLALRAKVTRYETKADEAEAAAVRAGNAQLLAINLPAIEAKLAACEVKASRAEEDITQFQQKRSQIQSEIESSQKTAAAKVENLEARIEQLEKECNELHESRCDRDCSVLPSKDQVASTSVFEDLKVAQEKNKGLISEVRQARANRDKAGQVLDEIRCDLKRAQERASLDKLEREDLERQQKFMKDREAQTQAEIERLLAEVADLEQRRTAAEEYSRNTRQKCMQIEELKQAAKIVKQERQKQANDMDFRLQRVCVRMDKERPGAPLAHCLKSHRLFGGDSMPSHTLSSRVDRGKKVTGRALNGGSDADVESTTAGESAADRLQGIEGLAAE